MTDKIDETLDKAEATVTKIETVIVTSQEKVQRAIGLIERIKALFAGILNIFK